MIFIKNLDEKCGCGSCPMHRRLNILFFPET
jgi:hypothetical protein